MEMNVKFESREELLKFVSMFGVVTPIMGQGASVNTEIPKEVVKVAAEKTKDKKVKVAPVEDKKEEATKVEAEVTGVDTNATEPTTDAEIKEENLGKEVKITKEMVREICSKAMKTGKSTEVKNIISKYGAANIPGLKEECYADAYKDVEALL